MSLCGNMNFQGEGHQAQIPFCFSTTTRNRACFVHPVNTGAPLSRLPVCTEVVFDTYTAEQQSKDSLLPCVKTWHNW